mmetsp:Transcript_75388/g.142274  ORF Transcript_75388/g.142274 Transcript_75388/m.142274 type:complete len:94 (+) Transcript_75388:296-577(+)
MLLVLGIVRRHINAGENMPGVQGVLEPRTGAEDMFLVLGIERRHVDAGDNLLGVQGVPAALGVCKESRGDNPGVQITDAGSEASAFGAVRADV